LSCLQVLFRVDLNNRAKPLDCLRFQSGAETFKIKSLTKMRRLQDAWLKTPSCVPATVLPQLLTEEWRSLLEFTLQGQPLTDDDTAQSLGMEDKAVLIVRSLRSSPALTPIEAAPLRLADDIAGLLEKEEFHDVSFLVGGERERIGANRTILAARSERFRYLVVQSNSPPDSQMEVTHLFPVVCTAFVPTPPPPPTTLPAAFTEPAVVCRRLGRGRWWCRIILRPLSARCSGLFRLS